MKTGYTVENVHIWNYANEIMVCNYQSLNEVVNLPIVNRKQLSMEYTIGFWTSKCIHDWKTNPKEQYQECKKWGKGHAL